MTLKEQAQWIKSANYYWMSEDYAFIECLEKTRPDNATSEDVAAAHKMFIDNSETQLQQLITFLTHDE